MRSIQWTIMLVICAASTSIIPVSHGDELVASTKAPAKLKSKIQMKLVKDDVYEVTAFPDLKPGRKIEDTIKLCPLVFKTPIVIQETDPISIQLQKHQLLTERKVLLMSMKYREAVAEPIDMKP